MKVGDKIICKSIYTPVGDISELTLNKIYVIKNIFIGTDEYNNSIKLISIINDNGIFAFYYIKRFINLTEERKNKLKRLNER